MTVAIVASEIGSVRALMPVAEYMYLRGDPFVLVDCGVLREHADPDWGATIHVDDDDDIIERFLSECRVSALLFSVNVKDRFPLRVARAAQRIGLPSIHVLDYWNGYRSRMELDGDSMFSPTVYVVPDQYAARQAVAEGIDKEVIRVFGQPAFADAAESYNHAAERSANEIWTMIGLPRLERLLLFVSEPVKHDQGASLEENPGFRGYTEDQALSMFIDNLRSFEPDSGICILPHPRQHAIELEAIWRDLNSAFPGRVVAGIRGRDLLPFAAGVAGMASTLLYEAWMASVPVLSLQPGLRLDSLRMLQGRKGVTFIDDAASGKEGVFSWYSSLGKRETRCFRQEFEAHCEATERIVDVIEEVIVNG